MAIAESPLVLGTGQPKVLLYQFVPEHADDIFALIDSSREHLSQHGEATSDKYRTRESVLRSITHPRVPGKLRFGIWDDESLVGSINFSPFKSGFAGEVGYWLGANCTRRGYATIATRAVVKHAFGQGFEEVVASVALGNDPSKRVLERVGFVVKEKVGDDLVVYHIERE